jgi:hypothetical protein
MGRTVIVGDVHGCAGELEALLERVAFSPGTDRLVFVGDVLARGPDSHGVLALMKALGATSVRGNHEGKLLAWRRRAKPLGPDHDPLSRTLSEDEWRLLESMPLWIDLPEHGLRVVHAGVVPGLDVGHCPPEALLKMRTIDSKGRWSDEPDGGTLWGTLYEGPPHIVFGHHARAEPQLHDWATGLDTGCVYGGRLSALVLDEGETMPRGAAASSRLESVRAKRTYYGDKVARLGH